MFVVTVYDFSCVTHRKADNFISFRDLQIGRTTKIQEPHMHNRQIDTRVRVCQSNAHGHSHTAN